MLQPGHAVRDIMYFLYCCTDSEWRKKHFDQCLEIYFAVLSGHMAKAGVDMTFEEFKKEVDDRRGLGLFICPQLLPISLNPEKRDCFRTWKSMSEFYKWRDEIFSVPDRKTDHPMIKEIRRRMVDAVEEAHAIGIF